MDRTDWETLIRMLRDLGLEIVDINFPSGTILVKVPPPRT